MAYGHMKNPQLRRRHAPQARKGGPSRPARSQHTVFRQVCDLIPSHMIPVLARAHTIDPRGFSTTSHVQALIYGHTSHALSLKDICDALSVHASEFMRVRGATPPARNTFANANRTRDPAMTEALYWQMLTHLQTACPGFTQYGKHAGFIFRLTREIFAMDSTTLQLTLASIDCAKSPANAWQRCLGVPSLGAQWDTTGCSSGKCIAKCRPGARYLIWPGFRTSTRGRRRRGSLLSKKSVIPPSREGATGMPWSDRALTVPALAREGLLPQPPTGRSDHADEARAKQQQRGGFGNRRPTRIRMGIPGDFKRRGGARSMSQRSLLR